MANIGFGNRNISGSGDKLGDIKIAFWPQSARGISYSNQSSQVELRRELLDWLNSNDRDIIVLLNSAIYAKDWLQFEKLLPEDFKWMCQYTRDSNSSLTTSAVVGVRNSPGLMIIGLKNDVAGLLIIRLMVENVMLNVCVDDGSQGPISMMNMDVLNEETKQGGAWILGVSWRVKVGELPGGISENGELLTRTSVNKAVNETGIHLIRWVQTNGWDLLNGCTKGDFEGKCAYNLVMVKGIARKSIIKFVIEDHDKKFTSYYCPMLLQIKRTIINRCEEVIGSNAKIPFGNILLPAVMETRGTASDSGTSTTTDKKETPVSAKEPRGKEAAGLLKNDSTDGDQAFATAVLVPRGTASDSGTSTTTDKKETPVSAKEPRGKDAAGLLKNDFTDWDQAFATTVLVSELKTIPVDLKGMFKIHILTCIENFKALHGLHGGQVHTTDPTL